MPGPAIRAIIFDIGRVIVRSNVRRALATLGTGSGFSAEQVWSAIESDPRWHDWQEGRISPRDWHQHLARRLSFQLGFEQFCAAWNIALDPDTILPDALFSELAGNYRLALLSNTDPIHVAHMESVFTFPRHFHVRIYSCAVGASKPNPAIYHRVLEATGTAPKESLYIDDVAAYVQAAQQVGMQGLVFQGPDQLMAEFNARGILASPARGSATTAI